MVQPEQQRVQTQNLAALGVQVPGRRPTFALQATAWRAGVWLTGNSRPVRLKIEQPWECKSPHADQPSLPSYSWQASLECQPDKRTGRCLLNSALLETRVWCKSTAFRHCCAFSSKRTGGYAELENGALPENAHHFRPCGVVQPTRLPLMQEITGAKPVRDANFYVKRALPDPGRALP